MADRASITTNDTVDRIALVKAVENAGYEVPASFSVRRPGQASVTELEGSNSRHDVTLTDADFTPESLRSAAAKAK